MRAEVVALRGANPWLTRAPLLTYLVPDELADSIQPGQLVSIPVGVRAGIGLVWSLDASDEINDDPLDAPNSPDVHAQAPMEDGLHRQAGLRPIASVLLPIPLVSSTQRA